MKHYVNTAISISPELLSFPHHVTSKAPVLFAVVIIETQLNCLTVNGLVIGLSPRDNRMIDGCIGCPSHLRVCKKDGNRSMPL